MDIFEQISKVDARDTEAIEDEDFKKAFSPFMMLRWYSGTKDPLQIQLLNELVNPMIFSLHREKELLYYLFCCCSSGKNKRYSWIKRPKKDNVNVLRMICEYYNLSGNEARTVLKTLSKEDLLEILECMGYDDTLCKKIKKAI